MWKKKSHDALNEVALLFKWLPEDDAYQIFLADEFAFEIALAAKGQKQLNPIL